MRKYRLTQFHPEHMNILVLPEPDTELLGSASLSQDQMAYLWQVSGPAYTLWWGHDIIACMGMASIWPGVGELWFVPTLWMQFHKFFLHRTALRLIKAHMISHNIHRLQAIADADSASALRWLYALGFKVESLMHKYGPSKETYIRFVRFE